MLTESPLNTFLDDLASNKPAPGGGSAAALCGSVGAALVSMVANLTVGRKKYAGVEDQVKSLLGQADALRSHLLSLIEEDIAVYTDVSNAGKMPRDTDEQKAARTDAMQLALKAATMPPMKIVEACRDVLQLCMPIAEIGNVGAVSDAGVAALAAEAGMRAGALNVLINRGMIKDETFVRRESAHLAGLLTGMPELKEEVYSYVVSKL
jgi:formiminotetrahydrofolate cyclodeaminase